MQPLEGSFVALVTPMESDGSLDFQALEALIEWHIESGTNGLVSVGTTGESATVSVSEHIEIIKKTKEISHLPLIKQRRLSVMAIDYKSWKIIYKMGKV